MNKPNGFSSILVIISVVAILGVFALYVFNTINKSDIPDLMVPETTMTNDDVMMEDKDVVEFEALEEDENTPEEINNESLNELDSIMVELDSDTTLDGNLNDLAL